MNTIVLKLYVTGQTGRSEVAVASMREMCERVLEGECELIIIDVLKGPHLAEKDGILATPTLVKVAPPPPCRVIGDLSAIPKVRARLEI